MTIETQQVSVIYQGDGASARFAVPYPFPDKTALQVYTGTGELGSADTLLALGLDYHVEGTGDSGGTVVLPAPLAPDLKIAILRFVPYTQLVDYPEGGDFPAQTHERALDKLTMEVQQLQDLFTRTPYGPPTSGGSGQEIINEMLEWYQATGHSATSAAASAASAAVSERNAAQSAGFSATSALQAKADADRAAALADPASLASSVYNVRKAFVAEQPVPAGGVLALPGFYYPARDVLFLAYEGTVCTPRIPGAELSGEYQYEEVGNDPDVLGNQIVVWFDVAAGDVFDMWVVASAAGRNVAEIEALVAHAGEYSRDAADSLTAAAIQADRAEDEADRAESAAQALPDISAALDGQVIAARSVGGEMRAGYEYPPSGLVVRQHAALSADLPAGTAYAVPSYIVGACKLHVFMDGVLCRPGDSEDTASYRENGINGATSTAIAFFDNLSAGTEITAVSAA